MADNYREITYREVDVRPSDIEETYRVVYKIKVRCPYCGGDCEYTYEKLPKRSEFMICNDGPDCAREFLVNFRRFK